MTDVRQIPFEDIVKFFKANKKSYKNRDDAYDKVLTLLKDKKAVGHPISIIEWMIAHNLILNKIYIPTYSIYDIDNMSQIEINQLAKLLTMKGNNRENIKHILGYLGELSLLLPEVNDIIFNTLNDLEIKDLDISKLKYDDIVKLLKIHRNKQAVRKFIFDNLDKIIIYNSYHIDFDNLNFLYFALGDIPAVANIYNKYILIDIIKDNKQKFLKAHNEDEINFMIEGIELNENEDEEIEISKGEMYYLIDFTFDLIKINELGLAKEVFDIANELKFFARDYPYNFHLVDQSIIKDANILKSVIDFIGEDEFLKLFENVLSEFGSDMELENFLTNLYKLEKYNLLEKIIIMITKNKAINFSPHPLIDYIRYAVKTKNDDQVMEFIAIINSIHYQIQQGEISSSFIKKIIKDINNVYNIK